MEQYIGDLNLSVPIYLEFILLHKLMNNIFQKMMLDNLSYLTTYIVDPEVFKIGSLALPRLLWISLKYCGLHYTIFFLDSHMEVLLCSCFELFICRFEIPSSQNFSLNCYKGSSLLRAFKFFEDGFRSIYELGCGLDF